jgi:cytochrome c553
MMRNGGRRAGIIKANLRLALQTAVLAMVFAAVCRADEWRMSPARPLGARLSCPLAPAVEGAAGGRRGCAIFPKQQFQAKLEYCETCHGLSGQGYRGYFPMPRLAGQQPKYLENQMRAFVEHKRANSVMSNVAHFLSPSMVAGLAAYFGKLNPNPIGGAPQETSDLGKTIYETGLPEANVPACLACHGPKAEGQGEIPRLAGQLFSYTIRELTNWNKERGKSAAAIMGPIAHNLTQPQIAAVAAYLSRLR